MKGRTTWFFLATLLAAAMLALAACGGDDDDGGAADTAGGQKDKVTLQSKWVPQAQFAGYYAALAKGYYDEEGLDVTIKAGGPDITPEQVVASGGAEFGIDWLPSLLATRDKGGDIVNIAQVFARSGHDRGDLEGQRNRERRRHEGQEGRRLVLRQRVRAVRGTDEERDRPEEQGRGHDRQPAVRHEPVRLEAGRRGGGDDLQRARAGARAEEPRHGRPVHARRPERDHDGRRRHRRCSRTACSSAATGSRTRRTRTSRSAS